MALSFCGLAVEVVVRNEEELDGILGVGVLFFEGRQTYKFIISSVWSSP